MDTNKRQIKVYTREHMMAVWQNAKTTDCIASWTHKSNHLSLWLWCSEILLQAFLRYDTSLVCPPGHKTISNSGQSISLCQRIWWKTIPTPANRQKTLHLTLAHSRTWRNDDENAHQRAVAQSKKKLDWHNQAQERRESNKTWFTVRAHREICGIFIASELKIDSQYI